MDGRYHYASELNCDNSKGWLRDDYEIDSADAQIEPNCVDLCKCDNMLNI